MRGWGAIPGFASEQPSTRPISVDKLSSIVRMTTLIYLVVMGEMSGRRIGLR